MYEIKDLEAMINYTDITDLIQWRSTNLATTPKILPDGKLFKSEHGKFIFISICIKRVCDVYKPSIAGGLRKNDGYSLRAHD